MTLRPTVLPAFQAITARLEGVKDFLYLDVLGLPTTEAGCLLKTVEQALPLDWRRPDGTRATHAEIAAEWHLINDHQELAGKVAEHALRVPRPNGAGPLRLSPEGMARLRQERLDATVRDFTRQFPAWGEWPAAAQLALLLSGWATGTRSPYPKRDAALLAQDFETAAAESAIRGNVPRSEVVKSLFLVAAQTRDPDALTLPWLAPPPESPTFTALDREALLADLSASLADSAEAQRIRDRDAHYREG
jgi:hypothetical protein